MASSSIPASSNSGFLGVNAEASQLRAFAEAPLQLGKARERSEPTTWSHRRRASWSLGSRLITGLQKTAVHARPFPGHEPGNGVWGTDRVKLPR
jgi:hypothetical protein